MLMGIDRVFGQNGPLGHVNFGQTKCSTFFLVDSDSDSSLRTFESFMGLLRFSLVNLAKKFSSVLMRKILC